MSKKQIQSLPFGAVLIVSAAVFTGHFGVGDTIFPAILGRGAGNAWFIPALGYGVVNSVLVFVAYLAVSRQNNSLFGLTSMVLGKGVCHGLHHYRCSDYGSDFHTAPGQLGHP